MQTIDLKKVSAAGLLITLGIIFGDIGTSPLYVLKAIIGNREISKELVYGGISCIFWTLTLQTTLKYVLITLRADNHGEGGIFSLFTLVRRKKWWLYIPAIIGGSALLADSIITPSISVSSAIEGLRLFDPEIPVVPIVLLILLMLFFLQQFGSSFVGTTFGPIMLGWFTMLAVLGTSQIIKNPQVLEAVNPLFAYNLLMHYPGGFWLLGAVFLCTTGAEALYSDLGHCGKKNIQYSWLLVKVCLLLNYFGQGALLIESSGEYLTANPFFSLMPEWFLIPGIITSTLAAIVASQALISGAFTLINEAIRLNFWPKVRIVHPTNMIGQVYIPSLNWLLFFGCTGIILYFKESANMEAAYGLSIILTMIMTSLLLVFYLQKIKLPVYWLIIFVVVYGVLEVSFLVANLEKFTHGGWITPFIACILISIMMLWYHVRKIRNKYMHFEKLEKYLPMLQELSEDKEIPKLSTHLIYLTSADKPTDIEMKNLHSIFQRRPKRADVYWFLHVDVQDQPNTMEYKVTQLLSQKVFRVDFKLGFRVAPRINLMFRKVVEDMVKNGEVDILSRYGSLNKNNIVGDFHFVLLERFLSYDYDLPNVEKFILKSYFALKWLSLSEEKAFGLDTSSTLVEKVPIILTDRSTLEIKRTYEKDLIK